MRIAFAEGWRLRREAALVTRCPRRADADVCEVGLDADPARLLPAVVLWPVAVAGFFEVPLESEDCGKQGCTRSSATSIAATQLDAIAERGDQLDLIDLL